MATFLYGAASAKFATAALNWSSAAIWGLLVDATYSPKQNVDANVSDIPSSSIIARQGPMTGKTTTNGICAGTLPTFNALVWPVAAKAIVLYVNSGSDSTSGLIYYSSDGSGFPFVPQGFNYAVANDLSQAGWFQV